MRQRLQRMAVGHSPDDAEQWLNWAVMLLREPDQPSHAIGHVQATVLAATAVRPVVTRGRQP